MKHDPRTPTILIGKLANLGKLFQVERTRTHFCCELFIQRGHAVRLTKRKHARLRGGRRGGSFSGHHGYGVSGSGKACLVQWRWHRCLKTQRGFLEHKYIVMGRVLRIEKTAPLTTSSLTITAISLKAFRSSFWLRVSISGSSNCSYSICREIPHTNQGNADFDAGPCRTHSRHYPRCLCACDNGGEAKGQLAGPSKSSRCSSGSLLRVLNPGLERRNQIAWCLPRQLACGGG